MKIEVSEYYREKGFTSAYLATNKEPRRVCTLRKPNGYMTSMSYAKYLYTSHYRCGVEKGNQVDHINSDRMDDRIENLQVVSQRYNTLKDKKAKEMVCLTCPICGAEFLYHRRNLSSHPNPCCSRRCGGIKSHKR